LEEGKVDVRMTSMRLGRCLVGMALRTFFPILRVRI